MRRHAPLPLLLLAVLAAPSAAQARAQVADSAIRPPDARTSMDTNPANLASAVLTHAFGQLPVYIDEASFRLLPYDPFRAAVRGTRSTRTYVVRTPRTSLVLDTVVASALTEAQARADARNYRVDVSLDGSRVPQPRRYWVFYRNNGPQVCRIYFPGDLGSLNMAAHSLVLRPLSPGRHDLHVVVRQRIAGGAGAELVTNYTLTVLDRRPNARERAIAPPDDANPRSLGNTPLTFRTPKG